MRMNKFDNNKIICTAFKITLQKTSFLRFYLLFIINYKGRIISNFEN